MHADLRNFNRYEEQSVAQYLIIKKNEHNYYQVLLYIAEIRKKGTSCLMVQFADNLPMRKYKTDEIIIISFKFKIILNLFIQKLSKSYVHPDFLTISEI